MEINIRLVKNFVSQYNKLQTEFGTDIARLNGFDDNQLSYTDFIDNFVDEKTVADSSIDGNSNVSHKDIVTLEREMPKPHSKLLAFNKIYYEISKKFGFKVANTWLRMEWIGNLYMHDAPSSTFRSYCFTGDTKILTSEGVFPLKELAGCNIKVLNKNHGWEDATVQYFGKQEVRKLTLERYGVTKELFVTGNHKWFARKGKKQRYKNLEIFDTDELLPGYRIPFNTAKTWSCVNPSPFGVAHGFFTGDGDKGSRMRANFCQDKTSLIPYFSPANVTGNEKEYTINYGMPQYFKRLPDLTESHSYLYGWLSGYFAADGCIDDRGRCTLSSTSYENLEHVRNIMCILGMPVPEIRYQDRVSNLTGEMGRIYTVTLTTEYLMDNFFIRPSHISKINEIRNSKRIKKDRHWVVVSVEKTDIVTDVYCAVVPGSESFTLDGNILTHNCFAYDLKDLAEKGLYFIDGQNAAPAKHLTTFVDFVKEFVSFACNRTSGAVGLPNIIPYMYYFWRKDVDNDYMGIKTSGNEKQYAMQNFQRFIYAVNQPYMRDGSQSAFTNTSIFDHPYFEALFGGAVFPDGSFMIDYEEEIIEFQKWYMEVMSDIRSVNMFTFPVSTISLLRKDGIFVDEDFARWAVKHNMKWSDSNLFVDSSVNSLSNCCFDGDQECLIVVNGTVRSISFRDLYNLNLEEVETIGHHEIKKARVVRLPKKKMYRLSTGHGYIKATYDHIFPTKAGDKSVKNLTTEDILIAEYPDGSNSDVRITSIEPYDTNDKYVYCLEMEDQTDPYFVLGNGVVTHNCRLKSDIRELGYFNSIGGTALKVGSVKVNTINLARIALDTETEEEYLKELEYRTYICLCALDAVRHIIKRNVDKGILPNFTYGLIDFKYLYDTIGFIGIYETMKKFGYVKLDEFGNTYYTPEASTFGEKIFKTMRKVADEFIKTYECDYQINTEQIPGESAAAKLMQKDKFFYPKANIYDLPLYGNQFIPLGIQTTLQERVRIAAEFDGFCNGGSILHANIDTPFDSFDKAWKMVNYIAECGVTYFAFNTKIQACENNHAFYGNKCPVCGKPVATEYTRIVGFYTPIKSWSKERTKEYKLRKWEPINSTSEELSV